MILSREWMALQREAALAAQQIGSGVTALGSADHHNMGYYAQAFFGLSIGLERLAKLIVVADYAIENSGAFPTNLTLRQIGHNLDLLLNKCEAISIVRRTGMEYCMRPNDPVHIGIVRTLTEFARVSRYYNLDLIVGLSASNVPEPIAAWWNRVASIIIEKHYSESRRKRDYAIASDLHAQAGDAILVRGSTEDGQDISNLEELMIRDRITLIVQKHGRRYTLQIVRWLSFLITELSGNIANEALFGLDEPFRGFMVEDKYLLSRKSWSIYRP